jgi:hypothetical protein
MFYGDKMTVLHRTHPKVCLFPDSLMGIRDNTRTLLSGTWSRSTLMTDLLIQTKLPSTSLMPNTEVRKQRTRNLSVKKAFTKMPEESTTFHETPRKGGQL